MATATAMGLRCLVACTACERQFDAAGLAAGSRFHCACGGVIEVPRFRPHDAEVVRCASCSAPRRSGGLSCDHCGSDYTLHEQDLHTICPSCMTRISDRARFCHRCAKPIAPQGEAGAPTKKPCPSCGARHKMLGRRLGEPAIAILECTRCAGVWLSHDAFDHVRDHARETAPPGPRGDGARRAAIAASAQGGALYRRCPECRSFMNRRNYGRGSGIVIDDCKEHGIWFDARELENLLGWIRQGGEVRAAERTSADDRERERNRRIALDRESRAAGAEPFAKGREATGLELIRGVLGTLFDL